jgi:hypothetical protein
MKAIIGLLSVAILSACSSTSKEVYTEKRTLTYPKGSSPHIKDMYLRNEQPQIVHQTPQVVNYTGVPDTIVDDNRYLNSDVPYFEPELPRNDPRSLHAIHAENDLLIAQAYNKWLKERQ